MGYVWNKTIVKSTSVVEETDFTEIGTAADYVYATQCPGHFSTVQGANHGANRNDNNYYSSYDSSDDYSYQSGDRHHDSE